MKHLVPLYVSNYVGAPGSVQPGYKKFYLKNGHFKLYDGANENDLVLDRPLDNFTNLSGTVTSSDTVLTALEKLQSSISSIVSSSYATISWVDANFVPNSRTITINGVSYDLSANRSWIIDSITDAPIDGITYGRKDGDWVEISPEETQDLQAVTDQGNSTTNSIITQEGFSYDYGDGENYAFLGHVQDKEYSEFGFYTIDQSDDMWGATRIFANPETGIEIYDSGGSNISSVLLNQGDLFLENTSNASGSNMESKIRLWKDYTQLYITNLDTTESNTIEVYTNKTYTKKYITTDEGFEGDYLQLNTGGTETSEVGKFNWNDTDGTAELGLKGGNVTLQLGQENVVRVVNKTGANLLEANYQVVRVRTQAEGGAAGQRLAVKLAQADTKANHSGVLGLVTEDINNNQEGFITTFGNINKVNTTGSLQGETWNDGDDLWLSATVAGGVTNVEPTTHPVRVGYVVYAHSNNGKIFVKVDEGVDQLDELHDVTITGATGGDLLVYNGSTQVWENKSLNEITGHYSIKVTTASSAVTGTVAETQVLKVEIPANSLSLNEIMSMPLLIMSKTGTAGTCEIRVKISTSSTMPSGNTDAIARYSSGANNLFAKIQRDFIIDNGAIKVYPLSSNLIDNTTSIVTILTKAFDPTITNYLYVSLQQSASGDSSKLEGFYLTNQQ
jgi:hypothetical protein